MVSDSNETKVSNEVIKVLILDFDGVVIESNDVKTHAFRDLFARFPQHAEAMMDFHRANVSLSRFAKFDYLLSLLGRNGDEKLRVELARDFSQRTIYRMLSVSFVPGAEDFLQELPGRIPVYLASVTPAEDLELILERRGLAGYFQRAYGCPPWTKPEAILDILRCELVAPQEVVLVGDSAGDQRAAAQTNIRFVGRDSGLEFDTRPALVFPDLIGVKEYVEGQLR